MNLKEEMQAYRARHLPQMPAYHLTRPDGHGVTFVNIGVGHKCKILQTIWLFYDHTGLCWDIVRVSGALSIWAIMC